MPTALEVREALAAAITAGCGLRAVPPGDTLPAPCAIVSKLPYDPRFVFSGAKVSHPYRVRIVLPRDSARASYKQADELAALSGSGSLKAAIENGDNWPISVDFAEVTEMGGDLVEASIADTLYLVTDYEVGVVF